MRCADPRRDDGLVLRTVVVPCMCLPTLCGRNGRQWQPCCALDRPLRPSSRRATSAASADAQMLRSVLTPDAHALVGRWPRGQYDVICELFCNSVNHLSAPSRVRPLYMFEYQPHAVRRRMCEPAFCSFTVRSHCISFEVRPKTRRSYHQPRPRSLALQQPHEHLQRPSP